MMRLTPSQEVLRTLLRYELETGLLFWRERPVSLFSSGFFTQEANAKKWNTKFANKNAFTAQNGAGYYVGRLSGGNYRAHRIIWKIVHNEDPDEIDHCNGVRSDNRLSNLRRADRFRNMQNMRRPITNTSGVMGVSWHAGANKWMAQIVHNGSLQYLGIFSSFDEAVAIRKAAERARGFHENHGSFT